MSKRRKISILALICGILILCGGVIGYFCFFASPEYVSSYEEFIEKYESGSVKTELPDTAKIVAAQYEFLPEMNRCNIKVSIQNISDSSKTITYRLFCDKRLLLCSDTASPVDLGGGEREITLLPTERLSVHNSTEFMEIYEDMSERSKDEIRDMFSYVYLQLYWNKEPYFIKLPLENIS